MVITAPHEQELQKMFDASLYATLKEMVAAIEARYSLDTVWHTGGKKWAYELKFRKGSKTICSFLFKERVLGFMVILGKSEQAQFEARRSDFSPLVAVVYDAATTYKDGKWILFDAHHEELLADFMNLLLIKRKSDNLRLESMKREQ